MSAKTLSSSIHIEAPRCSNSQSFLVWVSRSCFSRPLNCERCSCCCWVQSALSDENSCGKEMALLERAHRPTETHSESRPRLFLKSSFQVPDRKKFGRSHQLQWGRPTKEGSLQAPGPTALLPSRRIALWTEGTRAQPGGCVSCDHSSRRSKEAEGTTCSSDQPWLGRLCELTSLRRSLYSEDWTHSPEVVLLVLPPALA